MTRRSAVLLGLLGWVIEGAILFSLAPRSASRLIVDCVAYVVIGIILWRETVKRAREEPVAATGWWLIGGAGLVFAATSLVDGALALIYGRLPLGPVAIAVMDNGSWFLLLVGLLSWSARWRRRSVAVRAALDGVLLATSCFLLTWWAAGARLVQEPGVTELRAVRSVLPFALNSTSLGVIGFLAARSTRRLRGPLGWFGAGHLGGLVGAIAYAWATMRGVFYPGHLIDWLVQLPLFAFAMAPGTAERLPPPLEADNAGSTLGDALTMLPSVAVLVIGSIRFFSGVQSHDRVTEVGGMLVIGLLVWRQFLALRDVRRLTESLEQRVRDRTEALRKSQEQLIQAQRMEAVGRMAGGVAHDLNNVLTAIAGHLELLRLDLARGRPATANTEGIETAVANGSELARRLLTFAKPQPAEPRLVLAADAIERARQMARGLGRGKVDVEVRVEPRTGGVRIDPIQLDQVLANLAINAIDAMPVGGVVTLEVATVTTGAGRQIRFAVTDTGAGMDRATEARIFEPFFTTKQGRGTGLGLSTCYSIVTHAGGQIAVSSTEGVGTRFEVFFPEVA